MKNSLLRWLQWSTSCGKLRSKLLCIYFLLIVIPLGMFSLYAYLRVKSVIPGADLLGRAEPLTIPACLWSIFWAGWTVSSTTCPPDSLIYTMASNDPRDFTYIRRLEDSDPACHHLRAPACAVRCGPHPALCRKRLPLLQHQDKYRPDQPDRAERLVSGRRAGPADGCGVPRPTLGNLPKPGSRAFPPYRWYTIRAA